VEQKNKMAHRDSTASTAARLGLAEQPMNHASVFGTSPICQHWLWEFTQPSIQ